MEISFPISFVLVKSKEDTSVSFNQERSAMERLLMLVSSAESERGGGHVRGDTAARSQVLRSPSRSWGKDNKMT